MSDRQSVAKQLQHTRETLNTLRKQKAGHGMNVPADIELEIRAKEAEVARLEAEPEEFGRDWEGFTPKRTTPRHLVGQVEILGDIISPIVDEEDWECLK